MTRPRVRRRPPVGLAALLACAVAGPLAAGTAAAAPAAGIPRAGIPRADDPVTAPGALPVQIQVDAVSPAGALDRDGVLTITGRIVNRGDRPLTSVELRLRHRSTRLDDRQEVRDWLAGTDEATGDPVGDPQVQPQDKPLAPGAAFRFTLKATPAQLGVLGTRFGPRGLALEVTAGQDRARVGLYRTAVVWMPSRSFEPTPLAVVAPVAAAAPATDAAALGPALVTELGPTGRLTRVVAATAPCPQGCPVDWVIDPALLAAAAGGSTSTGTTPPTGTATGTASGGTAAPTGGTGTPSGTPSGTVTGPTTGTTGPTGATGSSGPTAGPDAAAQTGSAWLKALLAGRSGRETWLLPFADPDVAAVAHAGTDSLLKLAQARGRSVAAAGLGTAPNGTLAWPVDGLADPATLALYRATGHTSVLLDGTAVPPTEPNGNTLSAVAQLSAGRSTMRGLLYDRALSDAFAATGGGDASGSTQRLLADLAAITLERPYDPQPQVIAAPRGWDPQPRGVHAALIALTAAPWVDLTRLGAVASAQPGEPSRRPAGYPARARANELPADQVRAIGQADGRLTRFASALVEPAAVIGPRRDMALSLLSAGWRTDRAGQAAATTDLVGDVKDLTEGPVVEGGPFNLLTGSGELPLRVRNPHPFALKVELTLRPRSGRLVTDQRTQLQLPAGATRRVLVKVRSVADGTVAVDSLLSSPTGVLVGPPTTLEVRIHRNWETRGIGVLAVGLGLVFLVGLFRSVRRGRTRVPPQDVPDVDDLELYGPAEVPPPDPFVPADRIRPDDPSTNPQTLDLTVFPAAPGRVMPVPEPGRVPAQRSRPASEPSGPGPSRPSPVPPTAPRPGSSRPT